MVASLALSIAFALSGMAIYAYYHRKQQFDDPEDVKYQMFRDEE
jgi:hypothetical protein